MFVSCLNYKNCVASPTSECGQPSREQHSGFLQAKLHTAASLTMEAAQHGVRDVERAPAAPDKAKATPPPSRLGRGIAGALSVTLVVGIVLVAVVATGAKKNNNKSGAGAGEAEPPRLITGAVGCPSRSYYAGSRAACLAEVPDASHCPDEFPTWTEDGADEPDCALAVVGAGAGGLYAAWRLVEAGTYAASDVCVFEATERVGGRTYSVRYGALDLAVDAGAYRTWPEYTPVTHALIVEKLGTVRCPRSTMAGIASMASATQV